MNGKHILKYVALILFVIMGVLLAWMPLLAMDCKGSDCAACHTLNRDEAMKILSKTGGTVLSIKMAPVKGLFELLMERDGKQGLVYIDFSKKHLFQGFIVDFEKLQTVAAHATELPKPVEPDSIAISEIPLKSAIVMGDSKSNNRLYVFTDPDCPFCREMHGELKKLMKKMPDLAVYVMLYPLPSHPQAYDKSRVLIALKKSELVNTAFEGGKLPDVGKMDGVNELNDSINYARRAGINATPTLIFSDGKVLTGLRKVEELADRLGRMK